MIELLVEFILENGITDRGMVMICERRSQTEYRAFHRALGEGHHASEPSYGCIQPAFETTEKCWKNALYYGGAWAQHIVNEGDPSRIGFRFVCSSDAVS